MIFVLAKIENAKRQSRSLYTTVSISYATVTLTWFLGRSWKFLGIFKREKSNEFEVHLKWTMIDAIASWFDKNYVEKAFRLKFQAFCVQKLSFEAFSVLKFEISQVVIDICKIWSFQALKIESFSVFENSSCLKLERTRWTCFKNFTRKLFKAFTFSKRFSWLSPQKHFLAEIWSFNFMKFNFNFKQFDGKHFIRKLQDENGKMLKIQAVNCNQIKRRVYSPHLNYMFLAWILICAYCQLLATQWKLTHGQ